MDDYIRRPGVRAATKAVLYLTTSTLFAYGSYVIITF